MIYDSNANNINIYTENNHRKLLIISLHGASLIFHWSLKIPKVLCNFTVSHSTFKRGIFVRLNIIVAQYAPFFLNCPSDMTLDNCNYCNRKNPNDYRINVRLQYFPSQWNPTGDVSRTRKESYL